MVLPRRIIDSDVLIGFLKGREDGRERIEKAIAEELAFVEVLGSLDLCH